MRRWVRSTVLPLVSVVALVGAPGTTFGTATLSSALVRSVPKVPLQTEGIPGEPSPAVLVRVVHARRLPRPIAHPPYIPEPTETQPVTGPPRTTGVVALRTRKEFRIAVAPGAANRVGTSGPRLPAFTEASSVPGLGDRGIPPDTQLAVGPKYVVEFVNTSGEVFTHSGTSVLTFDLGSLFSGVPGQGGDPKIVYDAGSGRFFASYISSFVRPDGASEVDLAVTNNPTGTWDVYDVHNEGVLQDQPKLGVSSDKITMAWNDNGNSGPDEIKVIQKAALVADASSAPGVIWGPYSSRLNVVPAVQLSQSTTAYAVYHNYNSSSVGLLSFTGVPGISTTTFTETDMSVASTSSPPAAVQPPPPGGTSPTLDTGDDRLESAVWESGDLWAAGNDVCQYQTDKAARACLRVIHISTSQMSVIQDLDITMVGGDVMYPAVTLDARKDLWIAFSSSSTTQFASSEVAEAPGEKIGASIGAIIYHFGSGAINYSSCTTPPATRFGDYSGIAVDPAIGDNGIWAATEFGVAGCGSGTELGSFAP
jgi:hypothetical protein